MSDDDYEDDASSVGMALSYAGGQVAGAEAEYRRRRSEAEKEHNRQVFGITYREKYGTDPGRCVTYCLDPGQRKPVRCPACYGKTWLAPVADAPAFDPGPGRWERLARFLGRCAGEFLDGLTFPFRAGRVHTEALVRDLLADALEAGFVAKVELTCPQCEAAGDR